MKFLISIVLFFSATQVLAANGPCENFAKAAAIREYKKSAGTIQGSDGIQYSSVQAPDWTNPYLYTVTISDNKEDGETWEVDYEVQVRSQGRACKILSVQEVASRN